MSVELKNKNMQIKEDDVLGHYTTEVVKSGNSARINCQKKYLGKKVIVVVLDKEGEKDE